MAMFKKGEEEEKPEIASPPRIGDQPPIRARNVSVIGPTLIFKGELSADEDLIIEGQIEGTIAHQESKTLTIGKQGRVKADIHASSVIVEGRLVGDIHSNGIVSLSKTSDVTGNIYCGRIAMEEGARFAGKIDMGKPRPVASHEPVKIDPTKIKVPPRSEKVSA